MSNGWETQPKASLCSTEANLSSVWTIQQSPYWLWSYNLELRQGTSFCWPSCVYMSTSFLEAVPLQNIKASTILKGSYQAFSFVRLSKSIQSDQWSNFTSEISQQMMHQLNIIQPPTICSHKGLSKDSIRPYRIWWEVTVLLCQQIWLAKGVLGGATDRKS